jgi:hypothetical protein
MRRKGIARNRAINSEQRSAGRFAYLPNYCSFAAVRACVTHETISRRADLTGGWGAHMQLSKIISVLVVATVVAGVIINLPDIKRYIKISTM